MPKRANFSQLENMKVEQVHCVTTLGGKHAPVPIPIMCEQEVKCVALNASSDWLTKIVGRGCRGDAQLVVKEFVNSVLVELAIQLHAPMVEERSSASAGGDPATLSEPPKGRAAMGLDDDSDEEEVAAMARASKVRKKTSKKVDATVRQEFRTISIAGMELRAKPRWKCHGIAVPLEGDYLLAILKHLRKQLIEGEVPEPDAQKSERRKASIGNRGDEDAGRIRWIFPSHSYEVVYADENGAKHKASKDFKVPRTDALGALLDKDTFNKARCAALQRARAFWNKNDQSDGARYVEANDTDTE